jgi:hypothetical protein
MAVAMTAARPVLARKAFTGVTGAIFAEIDWTRIALYQLHHRLIAPPFSCSGCQAQPDRLQGGSPGCLQVRGAWGVLCVFSFAVLWIALRTAARSLAGAIAIRVPKTRSSCGALDLYASGASLVGGWHPLELVDATCLHLFVTSPTIF